MSICSSSDVDRYQESFSFDFNSSLGGLYTCDDNDNNDVDAYIEIELEPAKMAPSVTRENKGETEEQGEVEFRISLSAVSRKSSSVDMFSFPATCSGDASASAAGSKTLGILPPTWKRLEPPVDDEDFQFNENERTAKINRELLQMRNSPETKGGATKILVKFRSISFRSISFRSMLASLLKLGNFTPTNTREVYGISEVPPENPRSSLNKLFFSPKARRNRESSKLLEINLERIRKLFGASVGMKTANQSKSCPDSSPINENKLYARENSVQAAIAHCKKSFGKTDDFCFQVPGRTTFCGLK